MSVKLMLFDFDGTLADSFNAAVSAANRLTPEFGYEELTEAKASLLKAQGTREFLRNSKIPLRKLPSWIRRMKQEILLEIPRMRAPTGLDAALADLQKAGVTLGVVTSNSRENLDLFLHTHAWENRFTYFACGSNLFGKSRLIQRLINESRFDANETCYVGDEERDIEAARRAGVASVAVTWGFKSRELLQAANPDHLLDDPKQLFDLVR